MIKILLSSRLGDHKWSQADLARKTGIRAATINELYHGFARGIKFEHLDAICNALDCELGELIELVPEKNDKDIHISANKPTDK